MAKPWSAENEEQDRDAAKDSARATILSYRGKLKLQRPIFFVPGWTDEGNTGWTRPYVPDYIPIKQCISQAFINPGLAFFVTFTDQESADSHSFIEFSLLLRDRVRAAVGQNTPIDIAGHSMGGLDIRAAIVDEGNPLLHVNNCITVATPHVGSIWGDLCFDHLVQETKNLTPSQALQGENMAPNGPFIKMINQLAQKRLFLKNVGKLYCFRGSRDMAVFGSSKFNYGGMDKEYPGKVEERFYEGATHSDQDGITQDPRAMRDIIKILAGIPVAEPGDNHGNFK